MGSQAACLAGKRGPVLLTVHAGGMEDFATQEELQSYLQSLNKVYSARCAVRLWKHKVNTRSILANSSVEALMHAGVTEELHASNIKAKAGTSGKGAGTHDAYANLYGYSFQDSADCARH